MLKVCKLEPFLN